MTPTTTITRLILADGLSGSGKSTLCQWLELQLLARGIRARWVVEADALHPLHWWEPWDFEISDDIGTQAPFFRSHTPAEFIMRSIKRWQCFAATVRAGDHVYLVESMLFLLGIDHLMRAGATAQELMAYGQEVEAIISDLDPCLLYFRQPNVAAHARKICDIRGPELEHELIGNLERTPYARQQGLTGLSGVVQLWSKTQQITDRLVAGYHIRTLTLETAGGDWEAYYLQVQELLGIADDVVKRDQPGSNEITDFVGSYIYRHDQTKLRCEIVLVGGQLHIDILQPELAGFYFIGPSRELISISRRSFYAGISPVVISFEQDNAGVIVAMQVDSTRLGGGSIRIWKRDVFSRGAEFGGF
jgi:hypothetical protein